MAGYDGYSKSNNAVDAEANGRYPLTKAARIVARVTGATVREARRVLVELGTSEWHHSSKFYNPVDYYDAGTAAELMNIMKKYKLLNVYEAIDKRGEIEETEQERKRIEYARVSREKQEYCVAHGHDMKPVMFSRKRRDGGGEYIHHYRCTVCGYTSTI